MDTETLDGCRMHMLERDFHPQRVIGAWKVHQIGDYEQELVERAGPAIWRSSQSSGA
jgi:hypothetical protein